MNRYLVMTALLALSITACAKAAPPLPGDSVSEDGSVTLSPPRLSSAPNPAATTAEGPIEARLYPPELAMEHQDEIGITADQKAALIAETERGHSEVLHAQWELEAEKAKLVRLLDPDHVDEAKVKDVAARVMNHESRVKSAYLTMLVRVKNLLTTDQKAKLRDLRKTTTPAVANDAGAPKPRDAGR